MKISSSMAIEYWENYSAPKCTLSNILSVTFYFGNLCLPKWNVSQSVHLYTAKLNYVNWNLKMYVIEHTETENPFFILGNNMCVLEKTNQFSSWYNCNSAKHNLFCFKQENRSSVKCVSHCNTINVVIIGDFIQILYVYWWLTIFDMNMNFIFFWVFIFRKSWGKDEKWIVIGILF